MKLVKLTKKDKKVVLKLTEEAFTQIQKALATFPEYSVTKELERLVKMMEDNIDVTKRMY